MTDLPTLPLRYILHIYVGGIDTPGDVAVWSFKSDQPFMGFHAGDLIEPGAMIPSVRLGELYQIKAVTHVVRRFEAEIHHGISLFVESTAQPETAMLN